MKAIKKLRCITITSYQDQHTEILTLSRVETYRIKSKSKRNKWLKWIGVFFSFGWQVQFPIILQNIYPKRVEPHFISQVYLLEERLLDYLD